MIEIKVWPVQLGDQVAGHGERMKYAYLATDYDQDWKSVPSAVISLSDHKACVKKYEETIAELTKKVLDAESVAEAVQEQAKKNSEYDDWRVTQLQERLSQAEEALSFYADTNSWESGSLRSICMSDVGKELLHGIEDAVDLGGHRARSYFRKHKDFD